MGLENRDYIRDGSYTANLAGWGVDFTPVVKYLIIVNVVVFLLQIFITRTIPLNIPDLDGIERDVPKDANADRQKDAEEVRKAREMVEKLMANQPGMRVSVVQEWLELSPQKTIEEGQLWRLVTSAFCHDRYGIWHILFNMLALYWFGTRLERMYGSREFLLFYLAAAVCSSLAYVGLAYYSASRSPAIGASGAVMGVMMLYVIYYPFETFLIFWVVPVPLWLLLSVYVLYDLHPVLLTLAGDQFFTGVAHAGHLGGLAFGFLYWRFSLRLDAAFDFRWQGTRRRKLAPFREPVILALPSRDEFADRVDEILKKISEQGKESLTDEERNVLIEASRRYRNRD